jgi:subtilisin family serine protease
MISCPNFVSAAIRAFLLVSLSVVGSIMAQGPPVPPPEPAVRPFVAPAYPNDSEGDRIDDDLKKRINTARGAFATSTTALQRNAARSLLEEFVEIELIFDRQITPGQIQAFQALGGEITHIYQAVSYGWNGRIPLHSVEQLPGVLGAALLLVQPHAEIRMHLDLGTRTGRARPVWAPGFAGNPVGFSGNPNITIAIVDSGIDESHTDLNGRRAFWKDYTTDNHPTPQDADGHGTHVASIATGSGAAGGSGTGSFFFTQTGDFRDGNGVPQGGFYPMPLGLPPVFLTMSLTARWAGGGAADFLVAYHEKGTAGNWFAQGSSINGSSPLSLSRSFTPTTSRAYTPALLGNGSATSYVVSGSATNYPASSDGFGRFRGVAPSCRWAGAKVFTDAGGGSGGVLNAAVDDLVANRAVHNIKVMNLSLGIIGNPGLSPSLRQKVNTAVANGIVVVASAGNDSGGSQVDDPGRSAMALTVGASNDANRLTNYTSGGFAGPSSSSGFEEDFKPDLMAPGGSLGFQTAMFAADSNTADGPAFADQQANDYTGLQGTSMSSPFAAGCAALVIDAIQQSGVVWDFSSSQHSRLVKMLLCATSTESNAAREDSNFNPTLQRGASGPSGFPPGKDNYEGYGLINPDAAIEAATLTYALGSSVGETLGSSVFDRRAWARRVSLVVDRNFAPTLTVPVGADFDLHLYSAEPSAYGTPILLASSTSATTGGSESLSYTPTSTMEAIIVVKRISGSGSFTLSSPSNKAPQSIDFSAIPDQPANATVALSASGGGSGNPVVFGVASGPATITGGNQLSFTGAGDVTVTANQAGDDNHDPAPQVSQSFTVAKAPATVTLGSLAHTYDGTPKAASATTDPVGKTVTFTYGGSAAAPTGAGSYSVVATIDDAIYQGSANGTLAIAKAGQAITFPTIPDQLANATVALSASGGGSGNPVVFGVASGPATITGGNQLSFTGAGDVTVTANQAGDDNHDPAPQVSQSFTVAKAPATVTLGSLAHTYDGTPKAASATTDPVGKTVTFTYGGSAAAPTGAGSYSVVATIDDAIYQGSANGTLAIAKAGQAITFPTIPDQLANATVALSASGGGSGNPVVFGVASGPATITGDNQLSFTGAGDVTVTANQVGGANHEPAPEASRTFAVTRATATLVLFRLHQVADGSPREVVVATDPPDLGVAVTYNGSPDAPVDLGRYEVAASITDPRYEGSSISTLVVDDPGRLVLVPGGSLLALSELGGLEVATFQIGAYEVTGSLWATVVAWAEAEGGYDFGGVGRSATGDLPVTGIAWTDAAKWCNARTEWENATLGRSLAPAYRIGETVFRSGEPDAPGDLECDFGAGGHRLPTAAEWEYAARGGASGVPTPYPGGEALADLGWFGENSEGSPRPAGGKSPNALGLRDLAGNAAEWAWDGPSDAPRQRYLRGGGWTSPAADCALSALSAKEAAPAPTFAGFRLARSVSLALAAALDHPELAWEPGGDGLWFAQTATNHDGEDAAESPPLAPGESAWIETAVVGPGNLRFRWRGDASESHEDHDLLRLEANGEEVASLSGTTDWTEFHLETPGGRTVLRWTFVRGGSSPEGVSRAWLDEVEHTLAEAPEVTTAPVEAVGADRAESGGEVLDERGRAVTERGVVWSTAPDPEFGAADSVGAGAGAGVFASVLERLEEGTVYHLRAYAVNEIGVGYGESLVFTTDTTVAFDSQGIFLLEGRNVPGLGTQRFLFELADPRLASIALQSADNLNARIYDARGNLVGTFSEAGFEGLLLAGAYRLEVSNDGGGAADYALSIDSSAPARARPVVSVSRTALVSRKLRRVSVSATIRNAGNLPDVLRITATRGNRDFRVAYLRGGNVTARVTGAGLPTNRLASGTALIALQARVTPNQRTLLRRGRVLRRTFPMQINATSSTAPTARGSARLRILTR